MPSQQVHEMDRLRTGGVAVEMNATRAGYIPIPLAHIPEAEFEGIPFYLRRRREEVDDADELFVLYRRGDIAFTKRDRERLLSNDVEFIYVRMTDHARFRQEMEANLEKVATDPTLSVSQRSAIVYQMSCALVNEALADWSPATSVPRLKRVAGAISTLVIDDPNAFSHLFAASHHDFYTATHLVNVGTYMVGLAYACGVHDPAHLTKIGEAGLFHDIGKIYVPEEVLNKPGQLGDTEWETLRRHSALGSDHLANYEGIDPLVVTVTRQHHERMDGSGYPDALKGEDIHLCSRMCAIVDSFDAMTALRPFKKSTYKVSEALSMIKNEAPEKYDPTLTESWLRLMGSVPNPAAKLQKKESEGEDKADDRRKGKRYRLHCPARMHLLKRFGEGWEERPATQVIAHSISTNGIGVMSQMAIEPGERVRVYLLARRWDEQFLEGLTVRCRSFGDGWFEVGVELIGKGK